MLGWLRLIASASIRLRMNWPMPNKVASNTRRYNKYVVLFSASSSVAFIIHSIFGSFTEHKHSLTCFCSICAEHRFLVRLAWLANRSPQIFGWFEQEKVGAPTLETMRTKPELRAKCLPVYFVFGERDREISLLIRSLSNAHWRIHRYQWIGERCLFSRNERNTLKT